MRAILAALLVSAFAGALVCFSQPTPQTGALPLQPDYTSVNCSGFVSDGKIPHNTYLISGEQSNQKVTFAAPDLVYINEGANKGVKVGDRFFVIRPDQDASPIEWFKGEFGLTHAMGTVYMDAGQIRVVNVHDKVSVAEITLSCGNYMQRDDIVRPYEDRPAPPFKDPGRFDHFAPVSGKPVGMFVTSSNFEQTAGVGRKVYVNLGAKQGLKVGDYVRFFRYEGRDRENAYMDPGYQYKLYGFGSTPVRYSWQDLPREVLGEGIVLNLSSHAATVMVTYSSITLYAGDYVEIE